MNKKEILSKIKITDWIRPVNQKVWINHVTCNLRLLYEKTNEWGRIGLFNMAVVEEDENHLKEIDLEEAKSTLIDRIKAIDRDKEVIIDKKSEELEEDADEEREIEVSFAKDSNERYRALSYKETENDFYIKIKDFELV